MPPWTRQDFQAKLDSTIHTLESTAVAELAPLRRHFDATAPHSDDESFDSLLPAHVSQFVKVAMAVTQKERFRDRIARAWSISRKDVDSKFPSDCSQGFLQSLATFSERPSNYSYDQVFPFLDAAKEQRISHGKDAPERDGIKFDFRNGTSKTKLWQPVDIDAAIYLIEQNGNPQPVSGDESPAPTSIKPNKPDRERADAVPEGKRRRVSLFSARSPEYARGAPDVALPDDPSPDDEIQPKSPPQIPGYKNESAGLEAPDSEPSDKETHAKFSDSGKGRKKRRRLQSVSQVIAQPQAKLNAQPRGVGKPLAAVAGSPAAPESTKPKDTLLSPSESDGFDKDPTPDQQAYGYLEPNPDLETFTFLASGVAQGDSDQPQQLYDCLNPGCMLNDHVVNKATSLLTCHDGSIEMLDSVVTSATPKVFSKSTRLVYAPFFRDAHWMLLQLNLEAQGVSFFNSTSTTALAKAARLHVFRSILSPGQCSDWVFVERSSLQQDNTVDCGIFLLISLAYSMLGLCLPMQDMDITLWRVTMSLLLRGKLPSFARDDKQVQHNGISIADTDNKKRNARTTLLTAYDLANIFKVLNEKCAPEVGPLEANIKKLQEEVEARERTLQSVKLWPTCDPLVTKSISDSVQKVQSQLRKAKARRDNLQQVVDNGARIRRYMDKVAQKSKKRMQELEDAED
ncbi:hypothetical protein BC567DRAFT_268353 [Phyllosticta citribraziliensis]